MMKDNVTMEEVSTEMLTIEKIYANKKHFVEKLQEALLEIPEIRGIEYRHNSTFELVRIDFHGEGDLHDYINMTANNKATMMLEISKYLLDYNPVGLLRHRAAGDKLWEDAE